MILLHGAIECGGVIWAPVLSGLARTHRLVIPDLPGLGESEPVPRLAAASFDTWFTELIHLTCAERPTLVAHSMGGSIAMGFAAHDGGDLLRRLVFCAGPGVGRYRMPPGLIAVAIRFSLRPTEANNERFERFAFADLDRARKQDPDWFTAFSAYSFRRALVPYVKKTMGQLIKAGKKRVPDPDLERVQIPIEMVWGRHDRFVPLSLAERAHNQFGWPLHVIDDAGHVPQLEQPDAFVHALATEPTGSARTERADTT